MTSGASGTAVMCASVIPRAFRQLRNVQLSLATRSFDIWVAGSPRPGMGGRNDFEDENTESATQQTDSQSQADKKTNTQTRSHEDPPRPSVHIMLSSSELVAQHIRGPVAIGRHGRKHRLASQTTGIDILFLARSTKLQAHESYTCAWVPRTSWSWLGQEAQST